MPIFHCDAKPFALGTFPSPNAKDTNMLVSFALGDANFSRHPKRPNASQWNIGSVHGGQHKRIFQWNMGLRVKIPTLVNLYIDGTVDLKRSCMPFFKEKLMTLKSKK